MYVIDDVRPDLGGNIRHGDPWTSCPSVWRYLIDRFGVGSMLDVGCGEGHAVKFFQRAGVLAHGIDGLVTNVQRAVTPIALHDLTRGPYVMPVDLVWSCEVAEHIVPACAGYFLDTLANGRVVAMTHAAPGQRGHHHVNCQPADYWIEHMASRGFVRCDATTAEARAVAHRDGGGANNHFTRGMIFIRR
jgi:hypothetical protein